MSIETDIATYASYIEEVRQRYPSETIRNALLLLLKINGIGASNSATALIWTTPDSGTVTTTASDILPANSDRRAILIRATGGKMYLNIDADAAANFALFELNTGDTAIIDSGVDKRISAIADAGTVTYTIREGVSA